MASGNYYKYVVMQSAAAATGNGTAITVAEPGEGAMEQIVCQVSGTFVGTVTFEGTVDGTNWVAIGMTSLADNSSVATTATAPILVKCNLKGLTQVRARVSAYTSGAITVTGCVAA